MVALHLRSNGEEDGHPANKAHNQITKIKSAQPRESPCVDDPARVTGGRRTEQQQPAVLQCYSTCDRRADHWGPHPVKPDPSAGPAQTHVSDPLSSTE